MLHINTHCIDAILIQAYQGQYVKSNFQDIKYVIYLTALIGVW